MKLHDQLQLWGFAVLAPCWLGAVARWVVDSYRGDPPGVMWAALILFFGGWALEAWRKRRATS